MQHTAALGIWKFPVTNGQSLTATMEVPDDKDYQMALFDTNGNKLACSDNAGFGTPELMTYEVNNLTMVWLKVWTSASPSNSAATIIVSTPVVSVPTDIDEQEPNNAIETAQEIGVAHSLISGSVDSEAVVADGDDYFVVEVAKGNVVTVTAQVTSDFDDDLIYIALTDDQSVTLSDGENPLSFNFDENALSTTLTYTVPASVSEVYVWMAGIPGAADYEVEIQVHDAD